MRKKRSVLFILILILISISIGYAVLSSNLNIGGTSSISNPKWDIYFENLIPTGNITPITPATISNDKLTINYTVELNSPGDFYEFTVDVKNAGTLDAMINTVTSKMNGSTITSMPEYLEYYVKYEDGDDIAKNHLLAAGEKETYRVYIGFRKEIEADDLPSYSRTLNLSFSVDYVQANNSAIERPDYVFSVSPITFEIGRGIPSGVTTYNNYNDAINAYGHNYFLKHAIVNDIITETYVGFVYDGFPYFFKGGDGGDSYTSVRRPRGAFCSEVINASFSQQSCSIKGLSIRVYDYGQVEVGKNPNFCSISSAGGSYCS